MTSAEHDRSQTVASPDPVHPGADDHARVGFPPPLIHLAAVLLAAGLATIWPLGLPSAPGLTVAGLLLVAVSVLFAAGALREFARHRNPVAPNRPVQGLMTGGPFRFTRNPLYVALALLQAGGALLAREGWVLLTLLPALVVVRYYVIAREEAYLARRFGAAYGEYRARVRRWI